MSNYQIFVAGEWRMLNILEWSKDFGACLAPSLVGEQYLSIKLSVIIGVRTPKREAPRPRNAGKSLLAPIVPDAMGTPWQNSAIKKSLYMLLTRLTQNFTLSRQALHNHSHPCGRNNTMTPRSKLGKMLRAHRRIRQGNWGTCSGLGNPLGFRYPFGPLSLVLRP